MTTPRRDRLRILTVGAAPIWRRDRGVTFFMDPLLAHISDRADVTYAWPSTGDEEPPPPRPYRLEPISRATHSSDAARMRPPWIHRWAQSYVGHDASLESWLWENAHAGRFDVAMLFAANLGQYVRYCRVPTIWNLCDDLVFYELRDISAADLWRWPTRLKRMAFCALYERYVTRHMATTMLVSSADAAYTRLWARRDARVLSIPNGVNSAEFRPGDKPPVPGTVTFVGSMVFPPNIDAATFFARRVWPRIYAADTTRRFRIVGRSPGPEVKALAGLPGVEVHGDVPDVRPFVTESAVVVVPTRKGGGIKNKLLEACAMRRPVVASPQALSGLSANIGFEVLRAESVREWACVVDRLLRRPEYAERIAAAGYQWVKQQHSLEAAGRAYLRMFEDAANSARESSSSSGRAVSSDAVVAPCANDALYGAR